MSESKNNLNPLEKKLVKNIGQKKRQISRLADSAEFFEVYLLKFIARQRNRMEEITKLIEEREYTVPWVVPERLAVVGEYTNRAGKSHKCFYTASGKYICPVSANLEGEQLHTLVRVSLFDLLCKGALKIDWKLIEAMDGSDTRFYSLLTPLDCKCKTCVEVNLRYT